MMTHAWIQTFMGDTDHNNPCQPNQISDTANTNVKLLSRTDNTAGDASNRTCHVSHREWTDEERRRVAKLNKEERSKGSGFMKRIKEHWDKEFSNNKRTAQNLIDNAKRFTKEGWLEEREDPQQLNDKDETAGNIEWTMDMKVNLLLIDEEEWKNGKGFMRRMKDRWDAMYPTLRSASKQKLRDNASRFKQEKEITDLILVRKRQQAEVEFETGEHQESSKEKNNKSNKSQPPLEKLEKVIKNWRVCLFKR